MENNGVTGTGGTPAAENVSLDWPYASEDPKLQAADAVVSECVAQRNFIRPFRYFAPLRSIFTAMVFSNSSYDVTM
jgi:hypothetical protein